MRIGIVTYCHCRNYGADLQAYALQRVLADMGHDSEILDFKKMPPTAKQVRYKRNRALSNRFRMGLVTGFLEVLGLMWQLLLRKFVHPSTALKNCIDRGNLRFEKFWMDYIHHTGTIPIGNLGDFGCYDAYIAGSDQIWNWLNSGDLSPFFLMFAPHLSRRISYAASIGEESIPREQIEVYQNGLDNLDSISVRERNAQVLLQSISERSIEWVLDPTLLLTKEDWVSVASNSIRIEKPYVFSYSLNASRRYIQSVREYANKLGLQVVNIVTSPTGATDESFINIYDAGPMEFLWLLLESQFVFTNSFHGTIFAINFQIPFLCILNPASGGNSRIFSILTALGLSNRAVMDNEMVKGEAALSERIEFEVVHAKLADFRTVSQRFLKNALT